MILTARDDMVTDLFPTPTPSGPPREVPVSIDNTPLPAMAMIAIKIYAFGGLGFMICVVLAAIAYWIWTVIILREWADSPGWLDLHPERMREREKARIARLKSIKEDRMLERKRREEEKFTPPPLRYKAKNGRDRATSMPIKSAMRNCSISEPQSQGRKSSLVKGSPSKQRASWASSVSTLGTNASPTKAKKVSWASSTSTLDIDVKGSPSSSMELPIPAPPPGDNTPASIPKARTSIPHRETSVGPRSRRAHELIAATTPDVAYGWARSSDPVTNRCTCASVDPLDAPSTTPCEIHRYA
ncbi:hypothetical protein CPB84DRAFT_1781002 [Gymnopilus junonius]|uniref:Uncharacterized protein n=1 Tax=Gymnopilus junonius TaxID=109634 RepID=A0A9P5TMC9_GYMJU|nr:hypothetical protein CPB84DRAFT_1781002 [Gymnopilus junonius]